MFGTGDSSLNIIVRLKDEVSTALSGVQKKLNTFSANLEKQAQASRTFALGMSAATASFGAFAYQGLKVAGDLESMRQGFVTLLGSAEQADATMKRIKIEAARTPFEIPGLTAATQALALVTKDGNKSIDILLNVGKALAAAGKGQAELDRIIANLQQVALTGKLTEMDIRQFGMNGINIMELLGESMGKTTAEIAAMQDNGTLTFDMLTAALAKAGGEGGKFANAFTNQAGTFNQLMSNMKDSVNIFMSDFVKQTGIFDAVKAALTRFVQFLNDNSDDIVNFVKKISEFFSENKFAMGAAAGVIVGALIPALIGLGVSLYGVLAPLAPFIAAGALIGGLLAITGGFQGLLDLLDQKTGIVTLFQWAWLNIATTFQETLMPALARLWEALLPLEPILTIIAKVIGVALLVAINAVVLAVTGWVQILTYLVALGAQVEATILNMFVKPISTFIEVVKEAYDWLSKLASKLSVTNLGSKASSIGSKAISGVSKILGFEAGGTVPGPVGQPVPIIAHGQETIIPAGRSSKGSGDTNIQVTINNPSVRSDSDLAAMNRMINDAMRGLMLDHKLPTV